MSQALRPLPDHFIHINAPQRFEATWIVRSARARRAVAYVSRCEMFADPFGYLHSVRHEFHRSGKEVR